MSRPKKTVIRRSGKDTFRISFSETDGRKLAARINQGMGLMAAIDQALNPDEESGPHKTPATPLTAEGSTHG